MKSSSTLHLFIQVGAEIQLPVLKVPAMIRPMHFGSLRGSSKKSLGLGTGHHMGTGSYLVLISSTNHPRWNFQILRRQGIESKLKELSTLMTLEAFKCVHVLVESMFSQLASMLVAAS